MNGIVEGLVFPAEEIESPANLDQVEADETSVSITPFGECIRVEGALDLSGVEPYQIMRGCLGVELIYEDGQSESFKAFRISITMLGGSLHTLMRRPMSVVWFP